MRHTYPALGTTKVRLEADAVGAPALGPTPFMHRASAEVNPTAPLSHHHLDATHVTHGVLTAGLTHGVLTIEGSAFHGRESDEDRIKVEFGPLDSYSARLSWRQGPWRAQVSAGHLKFPDPTEFTDVNRFIASLGYTGTWRGRPLAAFVAVGVNREVHLDVTSPAVLGEATWSVTDRDKTYARANWSIRTSDGRRVTRRRSSIRTCFRGLGRSPPATSVSSRMAARGTWVLARTPRCTGRRRTFWRATVIRSRPTSS